MKKVFKNCISFLLAEDGQGMVEYAQIISLISIAAIGVLLWLGPRLIDIFTNANNALTASPPVATPQ